MKKIIITVIVLLIAALGYWIVSPRLKNNEIVYFTIAGCYGDCKGFMILLFFGMVIWLQEPSVCIIIIIIADTGEPEIKKREA